MSKVHWLNCSFSNFEKTEAGNTPRLFMQGSLLVQNDINKEDDGELVVLVV